MIGLLWHSLVHGFCTNMMSESTLLKWRLCVQNCTLFLCRCVQWAWNWTAFTLHGVAIVSSTVSLLTSVACHTFKAMKPGWKAELIYPWGERSILHRAFLRGETFVTCREVTPLLANPSFREQCQQERHFTGICNTITMQACQLWLYG